MGFANCLNILREAEAPNKQIKFIYKTMKNSLLEIFSQTSKQVQFIYFV